MPASHRIPLLIPVAVLALGVALASTAGGGTDPSQEIGPGFRREGDRQFDFWVGEWDVNLRIRQQDASWKDSKRSVAKIYRILDGKAILELWDEQAEGDGAIRGYSLRHYDPERGEWILYLNWPGKNRSGTSSLAGSFRHGRGEFFSTRKGSDGAEILSRYTFSDITPERLRWDDAFSRDGGKSWSHNWIMEFTRAAEMAAWPGPGEKAHTYHTGERCDLPEFRAVEILSGELSGEMTLHGEDGSTRTVPARLQGWKVLDGCAVMSFLEYGGEGETTKEFRMSTWNTYAGVYEETRLDNAPRTPVVLMYGPRLEDGSLQVRTRRDVEPARRTTWKMEDHGRIAFREEEATGEEAWTVVREGSFEPR